MGRKATATVFKDMQGTVRKDRKPDEGVTNEFEPVALMPASPKWMSNKWALEEWHRLGPILLRVGLLTTGNLNAFAQLCGIHGDLCTTYEEKRSPMASMVASYTKIVSEFGLTPASASKVKAADPVQPSNRFRGNGRR